MAITDQTRTAQQALQAAEHAPRPLCYRGRRRARAPDRHGGRDPVPSWLALAAMRTNAATEAAFGGDRRADYDTGH